jgi:hypothetical protein
MCDTGEQIVDKEQTAMCRVWHSRGECMTNPSMMLKQCAATCGIGEVVCTDTHADCVNWVNEGRCTSDADFMRSACAASCGICTTIADTYNAYRANADEL